MTDKSAAQPVQDRNEDKDEAYTPLDLRADVRVEKAQDLRDKLVATRKLGLKIAAASQFEQKSENENAEGVAVEDSEAPALSFKNIIEEEEEAPLVLGGFDLRDMPWENKVAYGIAAVFTAFWVLLGFAYLFSVGVSWAPQDLGAFLSGVFMPPALVWVVVSALNRRTDVQRYSEALRHELSSLLFPSEETARLINKDIERLCRQAAEVSSASKAVLKSLQRARQGLRAEIRDFSGVSKKAEFHIERLSESLREKGEKLLDITNEVSERTKGIDASVLEGIETWDQATLKILERSAEMEASLGQGADKILEAAERAHGRTRMIEEDLGKTYESLSSAVDEVAERLQGVSFKFDQQKEGLSLAAAHVSSETERLTDMIQKQVEDLEIVTDRTVQSMGESTRAIEDQKEALQEGARAIEIQSHQISDVISSSVDKLSFTVDMVLEKTDDIEGRIDVKAQALNEAVKNVSKQADFIEQSGDHAANKLAEALGIAVSGADAISTAVRRAVESLEQSTQAARTQADGLISSTKSHVEELNAAGEGNIEYIKEIVALLEKSQQQVHAVSAQTKVHIDQLSEAVDDQTHKISVSGATLTERVDGVRTALSGTLKDISVAVADADARHKMIEDVLHRRVTDLHEASEKAVDSAENIRGVLRGQAQEISTLSGQIAGQARTINEQMAHQKTTLSEQIADSLQKLGNVRDALETQAHKLGSLSNEATENIVGLRGALSSRCEEITEFTGKAFKDLVDIDEALGDKIGMLKEQADHAGHSITIVRQELRTAADEMEPIYMHFIEQAHEAQTRFAELKEGFEETSASNLERLQNIGVIFEERLSSLKGGASEAASILKNSSDHLQERVVDIEQASKSAHEKMREIAASLEGQGSDIHLITDQALLKVDSIQKAINDQFHELSASVGQALMQMQEAGEEFVKSASLVKTESEQVKDSFESVGEKARYETELLNEATTETVQKTDMYVKHVQKEAQGLLESVNESLFELKKSGDTFAIRSREVAEQMQASMKNAQAYGQQLKTQAQMIAQSAGESSDHLSRAVTTLTGCMNKVGEVSNDVVDQVMKSREAMAAESGRLLSVSTTALESVRDAAQTFGKQSESLFKASRDASALAKEVQESELKAQRKAFLSAAKFIIESLHSLSVDVSRMLEGDVPEKVWKAYQKGDVAAFTRKLSEMSRDFPIDRARQKFAQDTEFRTFVQRYIRQFEEVYMQAEENDHGSLLSATIASSEIGKLYQFLCQIAGKESRVGRELPKAA